MILGDVNEIPCGRTGLHAPVCVGGKQWHCYWPTGLIDFHVRIVTFLARVPPEHVEEKRLLLNKLLQQEGIRMRLTRASKDRHWVKACLALFRRGAVIFCYDPDNPGDLRMFVNPGHDPKQKAEE